MKRKQLLTLAVLILCIALSLWLAKLARPESRLLRGELAFDPAAVPSADYQVGHYLIKWRTEDGGRLIIESEEKPGSAFWQTLPGEAFVMGAEIRETVTENRSMFQFREDYVDACEDQTVDSAGLVHAPSGITYFLLKGQVKCGSGRTAPYSFSWSEGGTEITIQSDHLNSTFLTYASSENEHFFGFGEQFTNFDLKGKRVPIWVSEQGIGRGAEPITTVANVTNGGAGGNEFTTYAPFPFFISSEMYAFYSTWPDRITFDFTKNDRVQIKTVSLLFNGAFYFGSTPEELIAEFTRHPKLQPFLGGPQDSGRMPPPPEWVYQGAIAGMQGGTDKVQSIYQELKERDVPISAFWLQDWVGQRTTSFGKQLWWNWEVDYDRYPGWEQMVSELADNNIRTMLYVSPYLADIGELKSNIRRNLFQEARNRGYLVKNQDGEPYLSLNSDFYFGMIDLTNPEAREWYKDVLKDEVVGSGASGWMADYGEGLPYDAVVHDGRGPAFNHNLYPVLWAKLNREVVEETGGDLVFFNRAAYTGSPQFASLFWEGDQLVDWSKEDGIKSAVTGLNTSGLSGMAFNHSDIGGYTTITNPIKDYHRSRALLYRWMEMNAFTLIFRTHEGNQPDKNVQFYTDDETLDTFAYWAKVYAALFEYRKHLVEEAAATGLPVVRHPFIHYPDDPETWKITYQEFMLGSDFLIAPVTDDGATTVSAYLPRGRWVHLWSSADYGSEENGLYVTVDAPMGQPAVFYKQGSEWGASFLEQLKSEGLISGP